MAPMQTTPFTGKRLAKAPARVVNRRRQVSVQAGFIGSPNNLIMIASTTAFLAAGRFGLAPTVAKRATAGLQLVDDDPGVRSGDPAGYTIVDCLAAGALGHAVGAGIILGLKNIGAI